MTDAEKVIELMEELFADNIASTEHSPVVFEYQIKLAKWMLEQQREALAPQPTAAEVPKPE